MRASLAQNGGMWLEKASTSPAFLYLARLSPESRRSQREALIRLASLGFGQEDPFQAPWHSLTIALCATLRAELMSRYAPATARRHMAALRGVIQEAWRQGTMTAETRDRLLAMPPVPGRRLGTGRALSQDEIRQLYQKATCKERAMLALCLWGGLRRAEASCLTVQNVVVKLSPSSSSSTTNPRKGVSRRWGGEDCPQGRKGSLGKLPQPSGECSTEYNNGVKAPTLPPHLLRTPVRGLVGDGEEVVVAVRGKGSKDRLVQLSGLPAGDLAAWLATAPGTPILGLSPTGLWKALRRLGKRAGVLFTPHDLRRTYASLALEHGTDLATVQHALGHSDPRTTALYDRRGEAAQQKAARRLSSVAELCYAGEEVDHD